MNKLCESAFGLIILMVTAVAWATPVPDTGQTNCYDVAGNVIPCPMSGQALYGQDANYSINPVSYTKLDGSGNALPDSATSWAMVRDNVTGLIWEMKTNVDIVKNYDDPHDGDNWYRWYDSNPATNGGDPGSSDNGTKNTEAFLNALNNAHYGGYSDWRMPTLTELTSIFNFSLREPGPMIDTKYFPNTLPTVYWSSTTYASDPAFAWFVDFMNGALNLGYRKGAPGRARAVRGGQVVSADIFTDNGDGTVTDISTGLMWQKSSSSQETWIQALSYCEQLNLGGYMDWRLPNYKELQSIEDYSEKNPVINLKYFPDTVTGIYWSSTTYPTLAGDCGTAWGIYFYYDVNECNHTTAYKNNSGNVRAVRGGKPGPIPMVTPIPSPLPTECWAALDKNLLLHIPYTLFTNGNELSYYFLMIDFVYDINPTYSSSIIFKLANYAVISNPASSSCQVPVQMNYKLDIYIPDVLLPDGTTHLWVDLRYSADLSTNGNSYWVVSNYGTVSN
jgi:hypothetical protein